MQKYNVGIIGATADIANAHIDAIDFLDDFILTAVCDLNVDELATRFNSRTDVLQTTDYQVLINSEAVDLVILCTPNHLHIPMALDALRANKHVLCEKPMAISIAECDAIIQAIKDSLATFVVSYHFQFFPEVQYLKKHLPSFAPIAKFRFESSEDLGVCKPWHFEKNIGGVWLDWAPNALSVLRQIISPTELSSFEIKNIEFSSCFDMAIETRANIELTINNIPGELLIDWEADENIFVAISTFWDESGVKIELDHATNQMYVNGEMVYQGIDTRYRDVYNELINRITSASSNISDADFETKLICEVFSQAS
ncbi:MAG: putative dehydrogenase [Alteromonadaceae bacterium]|jgi:predicted dehydrogenase